VKKKSFRHDFEDEEEGEEWDMQKFERQGGPGM
jgi:hypothetical protein